VGWSWDDGPPPTEREKREAENALAQFDRVVEVVEEAIQPGAPPFRVTPQLVKDLNRLAVQGIEVTAGEYRTEDSEILGSRHAPPPWHDVPALVAEMCANVPVPTFDAEGDPVDDAPFRHSGYVMWRLNWIHPFADGNGRTARALSYLVLCTQLGMLMPGTPTIPELTVRNRFPYWEALEHADARWKEGELDVSKMSTLIMKLAIEQLRAAIAEVQRGQ
jgi:hypothetical protein